MCGVRTDVNTDLFFLFPPVFPSSSFALGVFSNVNSLVYHWTVWRFLWHHLCVTSLMWLLGWSSGSLHNSFTSGGDESVQSTLSTKAQGMIAESSLLWTIKTASKILLPRFSPKATPNVWKEVSCWKDFSMRYHCDARPQSNSTAWDNYWYLLWCLIARKSL